MAAPNLSPLPQPGLTLFPDYTAQTPCAFKMKAQTTLQAKEHHNIFILAPDGTSEPFLEIHETKRKHITFMNMQGQEVMTIMKNTTWRSWGSEYHGMTPNATEMWRLKLKRCLRGTDYQLSIFKTPYESQDLTVKNKVLGHDKGILLNGNVVAVMSHPDVWGHTRREDFIHVAPGMDILLALSVAWIRVDKQNEDTFIAIT